MCTLIDDQALRERCLKNAQDQILTQFTPDVVVTQFLSDIPEMKSYSAERHVCKALLFDKVLYRFSRLLDWAYLCGFYLLKTGISGFIKHFKLHFRERKAYLKSKGE